MTQFQVESSTIIALAFAIIFVTGASLNTTRSPGVKIINSTNIRELKHRLPTEDKSGAVAYVYPVTSKSPNGTNGLTAGKTNGTMTADSETPKTCVYRVLEGDYRLVSYNATKEELADNGKEIYDTICPGDDEWDKISAGALASLCCG